jgi:hypothetical protein
MGGMFEAPASPTSAAGGITSVPFSPLPPAGATGCTPTVVSNSSFITVGTVVYPRTSFDVYDVVLIVAPNTTPASRTGTITLNGATVPIRQNRGQIDIELSLLDPARTAGPTTECDLRGTTSHPTTCTVRVTVSANSGAPIISYDWSIIYLVGVGTQVRSFRQTGPDPQITFTDTCGQDGGTADGATSLLLVDLTLTDASGDAIFIEAIQLYNQPSLSVRLFTCSS